MFEVVFSFITAFLLTYFAIPSIINIAKRKNLCDEPGERRAHTTSTPSLGGIGIFAGTLFAILLWTPVEVFKEIQFILCAFVIIFLIGAKDDIFPLVPEKKLAGQLLAIAILVFKADIHITSFYGILGIHELPQWISVAVTAFTFLVIINAFNLIDGINGLAGSVGSLISVVLGAWFFLVGKFEFAIMSFALAGALVAFLKYNITPAQIFMGDTGAMLIGLICSILTIKFIELNGVLEPSPYRLQSVPAVAVGILILPLFDTLRVFVKRVLNGRSPFFADKTHIHHLLLEAGFTHMQATGILLLTNMAFIALVFSLQGIGAFNLIVLTLFLAIGLTSLLYLKVKAKKGGLNL